MSLSRRFSIGLLTLVLSSLANQFAFSADTLPKVGETAKDFELLSVDGNQVKLTTVLEKGPVVLVVLRGFPGYQCPVCSKQVGQLLNEAEKFKSAGATVLLVYPGPSGKLMERAKEFIKDKTIPDHFSLLVDPDYVLTHAYHLRWNSSGETAFPSTFVIQKNGKISFAKISQSHGGRTEPGEILKELKVRK